MTTVGELIEALGRFPRAARVSVHVGIEEAVLLVASHEDGNFEADLVQPVGCNQNDVQILLGSEI